MSWTKKRYSRSRKYSRRTYRKPYARKRYSRSYGGAKRTAVKALKTAKTLVRQKRMENPACYCAINGQTNMVTSPYVALNMTDTNINTSGAFNPIFNSGGFANCRKAKINWWKTNLHFTSGSEKNVVTFNVFIVKLRKAGAKLYDYEDGTYNLKTLTNGTHYWRAMTGSTTPLNNSYVFLNPNYFKTLKRYNFTLGQQDSNSVADPSGQLKKFITYTNYKCGYWTGADAGTNKFWYQQRTPLLPTDNVFMLAFNDNYGIDLAYPYFDFGGMLKATCYNT